MYTYNQIYKSVALTTVATSSTYPSVSQKMSIFARVGSSGNSIIFGTQYIIIHRRFIYKGNRSTHAEGTDPRGGLSERAKVRRHYGPLCPTLIAAKSGSICVAIIENMQIRCSYHCGNILDASKLLAEDEHLCQRRIERELDHLASEGRELPRVGEGAQVPQMKHRVEQVVLGVNKGIRVNFGLTLTFNPCHSIICGVHSRCAVSGHQTGGRGLGLRFRGGSLGG